MVAMPRADSLRKADRGHPERRQSRASSRRSPCSLGPLWRCCCWAASRPRPAFRLRLLDRPAASGLDRRRLCEGGLHDDRAEGVRLHRRGAGEDNQPVKAGQVLARIDDRDFRTALDQAKADVAAAEAAVRNIDAQHQPAAGRDRPGRGRRSPRPRRALAFAAGRCRALQRAGADRCRHDAAGAADAGGAATQTRPNCSRDRAALDRRGAQDRRAGHRTRRRPTRRREAARRCSGRPN